MSSRSKRKGGSRRGSKSSKGSKRSSKKLGEPVNVQAEPTPPPPLDPKAAELLSLAAAQDWKQLKPAIKAAKKAHLTARDGRGKTVVHLMAMPPRSARAASATEPEDVIACFEAAKKAGADLWARVYDDPGRETALTLAAGARNWQLARWLMSQKGARADGTDFYGWTALHFAAIVAGEDKSKEAIEIITSISKLQGADVHAETPDGITPVMAALSYGAWEVVDHFRKNLQGNAAGVTKDGRNAFHIAAKRGDLHAMQGMAERELVPVDAVAQDGSTALHYAARDGYFHCVRWLVEDCELEIGSMRKAGATPALLAASKSHWRTMDWLLDQGKKGNPTDPGGVAHSDNHGFTCLHYAARVGASTQVAKLFKRSGTFVDAKLKADGATPLHLAALWHRWPTCKELLDQGASPHHVKRDTNETVLHMVARAEDADTVLIRRLVYEFHVPLHSRNSSGLTPALALFNAQQWALLDDFLVRQVLKIDAGADAAAKTAARKQNARRAAARGAVTTQVLNITDRHDVGSLADINSQQGYGPKGRTILHVAAYGGYRALAKAILLHPKVDVDLKDHRNRTALDLAYSVNAFGVAEVILRHGKPVLKPPKFSLPIVINVLEWVTNMFQLMAFPFLRPLDLPWGNDVKEAGEWIGIFQFALENFSIPDLGTQQSFYVAIGVVGVFVLLITIASRFWYKDHAKFADVVNHIKFDELSSLKIFINFVAGVAIASSLFYLLLNTDSDAGRGALLILVAGLVLPAFNERADAFVTNYLGKERASMTSGSFFWFKTRFTILLFIELAGKALKSVFFIPVVKALTAVFDCTEASGQRWIHDSRPGFVCYEGVHIWEMAASIILLPPFLFWMFRLVRVSGWFHHLAVFKAEQGGTGVRAASLFDWKGDTSVPPEDELGSVFNKDSARSKRWEPFYMALKVVASANVILLTTRTSTVAAIGLFVNVGFLLLSLLVPYYVKERMNVLDVGAYTVVLWTSIAALITISTEGSFTLSLGVFLLVSTGAFIAGIVLSKLTLRFTAPSVVDTEAELSVAEAKADADRQAALLSAQPKYERGGSRGSKRGGNAKGGSKGSKRGSKRA